MSPKSPQPDKDKGAKGAKGAKRGASKKDAKKSKGGAKRSAKPGDGAPFSLVLLVALVLSAPTTYGFFVSKVAFETAATRFLIAMAVAWVLISLVFIVVKSLGTPAEKPAAPDLPM